MDALDLMLAFPFPYIATTMGWVTAEIGRQPWTVYGLQRTIDANSPTVTGGAVVFTLLGFMAMYLIIGVLFLYLVMKQILKGPGTTPAGPEIWVKEEAELATQAHKGVKG